MVVVKLTNDSAFVLQLREPTTGAEVGDNKDGSKVITVHDIELHNGVCINTDENNVIIVHLVGLDKVEHGTLSRTGLTRFHKSIKELPVVQVSGGTAYHLKKAVGNDKKSNDTLFDTESFRKYGYYDDVPIGTKGAIAAKISPGSILLKQQGLDKTLANLDWNKIIDHFFPRMTLDRARMNYQVSIGDAGFNNCKATDASARGPRQLAHTNDSISQELFQVGAELFERLEIPWTTDATDEWMMERKKTDENSYPNTASLTLQDASSWNQTQFHYDLGNCARYKDQVMLQNYLPHPADSSRVARVGINFFMKASKTYSTEINAIVNELMALVDKFYKDRPAYLVPAICDADKRYLDIVDRLNQGNKPNQALRDIHTFFDAQLYHANLFGSDESALIVFVDANSGAFVNAFLREQPHANKLSTALVGAYNSIVSMVETFNACKNAFVVLQMICMFGITSNGTTMASELSKATAMEPSLMQQVVAGGTHEFLELICNNVVDANGSLERGPNSRTVPVQGSSPLDGLKWHKLVNTVEAVFNDLNEKTRNPASKSHMPTLVDLHRQASMKIAAVGIGAGVMGASNILSLGAICGCIEPGFGRVATMHKTTSNSRKRGRMGDDEKNKFQKLATEDLQPEAACRVLAKALMDTGAALLNQRTGGDRRFGSVLELENMFCEGGRSQRKYDGIPIGGHAYPSCEYDAMSNSFFIAECIPLLDQTSTNVVVEKRQSLLAALMGNMSERLKTDTRPPGLVHKQKLSQADESSLEKSKVYKLIHDPRRGKTDIVMTSFPSVISVQTLRETGVLPKIKSLFARTAGSGNLTLKQRTDVACKNLEEIPLMKDIVYEGVYNEIGKLTKTPSGSFSINRRKQAVDALVKAGPWVDKARCETLQRSCLPGASLKRAPMQRPQASVEDTQKRRQIADQVKPRDIGCTDDSEDDDSFVPGEKHPTLKETWVGGSRSSRKKRRKRRQKKAHCSAHHDTNVPVEDQVLSVEDPQLENKEADPHLQLNTFLATWSKDSLEKLTNETFERLLAAADETDQVAAFLEGPSSPPVKKLSKQDQPEVDIRDDRKLHHELQLFLRNWSQANLSDLANDEAKFNKLLNLATEQGKYCEFMEGPPPCLNLEGNTTVEVVDLLDQLVDDDNIDGDGTMDEPTVSPDNDRKMTPAELEAMRKTHVAPLITNVVDRAHADPSNSGMAAMALSVSKGNDKTCNETKFQAAERSTHGLKPAHIVDKNQLVVGAKNTIAPPRTAIPCPESGAPVTPTKRPSNLSDAPRQLVVTPSATTPAGHTTSSVELADAQNASGRDGDNDTAVKHVSWRDLVPRTVLHSANNNPGISNNNADQADADVSNIDPEQVANFHDLAASPGIPTHAKLKLCSSEEAWQHFMLPPDERLYKRAIQMLKDKHVLKRHLPQEVLLGKAMSDINYALRRQPLDNIRLRDHLCLVEMVIVRKTSEIVSCDIGQNINRVLQSNTAPPVAVPKSRQRVYQVWFAREGDSHKQLHFTSTACRLLSTIADRYDGVKVQRRTAPQVPQQYAFPEPKAAFSFFMASTLITCGTANTYDFLFLKCKQTINAAERAKKQERSLLPQVKLEQEEAKEKMQAGGQRSHHVVALLSEENPRKVKNARPYMFVIIDKSKMYIPIVPFSLAKKFYSQGRDANRKDHIYNDLPCWVPYGRSRTNVLPAFVLPMSIQGMPGSVPTSTTTTTTTTNVTTPASASDTSQSPNITFSSTTDTETSTPSRGISGNIRVTGLIQNVNSNNGSLHMQNRTTVRSGPTSTNDPDHDNEDEEENCIYI